MSRKNIVAWGLVVLLLAGSLLVLGSQYVPPRTFWLAGVISYLIPMVVLVHILVVGYGIVKQSRFAIPSGVLLLVILVRWVSYSDGETRLGAGHRFTVLSYNASFFHNPGRWSEEYESALMNRSAVAMKEWLAAHDADIKCIQEFYNHSDSPVFNTLSTIGHQGEYHYFFADSERPYAWDAGLAIFSRFPIIDTGQVMFSRNAYNKAAFADVVIAADTVRIINVHLQSMGLEASGPTAGLLAKTGGYARKVKYGLIARSQQTEVLLRFIRTSPYPVVMGGDLNELPFGNAYLNLKATLRNAHETAGQGAGFTYNHPWLFFLRVDHQFYDPALRVHNFTTYQEMKYSDNFPIEATYSLPK